MSTLYTTMYRFASELVSNYAVKKFDLYYLNISDLPENDLGHLASMFLDLDDRETQGLYQEDDKDCLNDNITCSLIKLLQKNTSDNQEDFSTLVRNNVIKIYHEKMQTLIDEICYSVIEEKMIDAGLYKQHDKNNGEIYWSRY
jgi:hypothetical protein